MKRNKIIGVSRVRNVEFIINDLLNHISGFVDEVIIYDDCSNDQTVSILKNHSIVKKIIINENWESDRIKRAKAEGEHRQILFDEAKKFNPDWIYVFDSDEFIELEISKDDLNINFEAYYFRLFDFYITKEDINKSYFQRKYLGPEFRDIPMLFNAKLDLKFNARVPLGLTKIAKAGYVKHYGKAINVEEWNKKCQYYINHLKEDQPGNIDISDKWKARLNKPIHTKSDFNCELIQWDQKNLFGFELSRKFEKISTMKMKILVANHSLNSLGGSETFTFTIINELKRNLNFDVEYFCFERGIVSEKIENLGVKFMSKNNYDLILANHNTTVKKLFKKGLIIQTCHGIYPPLESPSIFADGYVSISNEVQNHLVKIGYKSKLIYNSIDLTRFYPKSNIDKEIKTILSLCHSENANNIIKDICSQLNLNYLEGFKYKNPVWEVENLINKADLVIGIGRSAYEAMACGRPVIVWDDRRYFPAFGDGYVRNILGFSLLNNCSGRYSQKIFSKNELISEIQKYNSDDELFFRTFALKHLDVRANVAEYIEFAGEIKRKNLFFKQLILARRKISHLKLIKKIINKIVK